MTPGQTFTAHVACGGVFDPARRPELSDLDLHFVVDGAGVVQPAPATPSGSPARRVHGDRDRHRRRDQHVVRVRRERRVGRRRGSATAVARGFGAATAATPTIPAATSGPQATPVSVAIVAPGQEATVTVTNVFAAAPVAPYLRPGSRPSPAPFHRPDDHLADLPRRVDGCTLRQSARGTDLVKFSVAPSDCWVPHHWRWRRALGVVGVGRRCARERGLHPVGTSDWIVRRASRA